MRLFVFILLFGSHWSVSAETTLVCINRGDGFSLSALVNEHRTFQQEVRKIMKAQPRLFPSPNFRELQEWTLHYQRLNYSYSQYVLLHLGNPSLWESRKLELLYQELADQVETLVQELPEQLDLHHSLNSEENREFWRHEINRALRTMVADEGKFYQMSSCDYVTAPLNFLWWALRVMKSIDQLKQQQDCEAWSQLKTSYGDWTVFDPRVLSVELD
jgi:hypothetical protein